MKKSEYKQMKCTNKRADRMVKSMKGRAKYYILMARFWKNEEVNFK